MQRLSTARIDYNSKFFFFNVANNFRNKNMDKNGKDPFQNCICKTKELNILLHLTG